MVVPVATAGLATVVFAAVSFSSVTHSTTLLVGAVVLLLASSLADHFPVPVEGIAAGGVSLSFVFGVSAILLFGWSAGVLLAFAAPALVQLVERRPPIRIAYNSFAFALSAGAAGAAVALVHGASPHRILARVAICAGVDYFVNILLVDSVVAVDARQPLLALFRSSFRWTIMPFTLMASAALILVVLWQRSPFLAAALIGPLAAIALYQRSNHRALRAMRLALTDPLTGLGNHRHFHERLQKELLDAQAAGTPAALCLIDIDDFKGINDRFGHPTGDHVLSQLAGRFRQNGDTFRLGGDEFALLLPNHDERRAVAAAESIIDRVSSLRLERVGSVTVSIGIAAFPSHASQRDELVRLADSALYWAKEHGKNRVRLYKPAVVELAELRGLADGPDQAARFRAAASLAKAVDARDTYTGSHSERVAELSARIATRMGLGAEEIELARLAGSLHDLGKLAVPEEILRKPGPLTAPERLVLERHPQIGFRMLESLGVDPVAQWVLHHHERWDGMGYPEGLAGTAIPLGARVVFVADAYDAMTSDRIYRPHLSLDHALAELQRCADTQFDPHVVMALADEIAFSRSPASALAS